MRSKNEIQIRSYEVTWGQKKLLIGLQEFIKKSAKGFMGSHEVGWGRMSIYVNISVFKIGRFFKNILDLPPQTLYFFSGYFLCVLYFSFYIFNTFLSRLLANFCRLSLSLSVSVFAVTVKTFFLIFRWPALSRVTCI